MGRNPSPYCETVCALINHQVVRAKSDRPVVLRGVADHVGVEAFRGHVDEFPGALLEQVITLAPFSERNVRGYEVAGSWSEWSP